MAAVGSRMMCMLFAAAVLVLSDGTGADASSSAGRTPLIIILTAYDWADVEEEAKEAGVTAFCSKPVFLTELRDILASPTAAGNVDPEQKAEEGLFCGRKILLVEDNEINQEIAKAILEEAGFSVDLADDGYDATKAIRAMDDPVKSRIPIVAMTANAFEEDRQMALAAGMNDHVAKPIDVEKLMETLKVMLAR